MATQEQIYTTKVILNSTEAKNEISALQKKVDELRKKKKEEAANAGEWKEFNKRKRGLDQTVKPLSQYPDDGYEWIVKLKEYR
ncbi:MAG: hypothetical protein IJ710_06070 [Prevotella sp.]|nr:hypothetical protein [Prevotella sp.]